MHCIRGPICLVSVNLETEPPFSLFLTFIHLSNPENNTPCTSRRSLSLDMLEVPSCLDLGHMLWAGIP